MLRHLLTGQWGDTITTTNSGSFVSRQYVYSIPADLNGVEYELGDLEIVAFLAEGQQDVVTGAEGSINFVLPPGTTLVDLASSTNMVVPTSYCDGSVTPEITITNPGNSAVSSYEVTYSLNGGTAISQTITTPLAVGASETVTFSDIILPAGEHQIEYSVNLVGSSYVELVTGNNISSSEVIYVMPTTAFAQTHQEGFEGLTLGAVSPNNAIANNPNDVTAFVVNNGIDPDVTQNLGGFGNSSNSFAWDFYSISTGESSMLIFEKLDLSSNTGHGIKFNHAYAQYEAENDKLEVLVSTDCGATWSTVFSEAGTALSTASPSESRFYPAVTEWRNNFIDLAAYTGNNEVMIAFKGTSAYGNNLYIDDIQVLDQRAIGIGENEALVNSSVYPNPSNGVSVLSVDLKEQADVNVHVYNSLGEVVIASTTYQLAAGNSIINLDLSNLDNGAYFVNMEINGEITVKRITLLK